MQYLTCRYSFWLNVNVKSPWEHLATPHMLNSSGEAELWWADLYLLQEGNIFADIFFSPRSQGYSKGYKVILMTFFRELGYGPGTILYIQVVAYGGELGPDKKKKKTSRSSGRHLELLHSYATLLSCKGPPNMTAWQNYTALHLSLWRCCCPPSLPLALSTPPPPQQGELPIIILLFTYFRGVITPKPRPQTALNAADTVHECKQTVFKVRILKKNQNYDFFPLCLSK